MIPILYDKTETSFTSNGLGRLASCKRCIVTEERNGGYECEFDFPINDPKYELIQEGQIIAATHDDNGDIQPFDIYHRTAPLNGVVTFYARHISYRLNGIVVSPFTASGVANAIAGLKTNSIGANPFTFSTDKTTSGEYTVSVPSTLRALLGGEENSLIDVFGTGEYEFDKFNVKLWLHRGSDTDVQIRYGKNLYDIEHDIDYSDSYNGVVPFWYNTDPTSEAEDPPMILVTASPVYASGTTYDGRNTVAPLDLTQDFQDAIPTSAELTTLATAKLNASDTLLPIENITVSFVQLWQTEEYASIAPLQQVKLCDTVTVVYPELGINGIRSKVIKVVYNTLLDRYDEIELGDALTNYAALITSDTRSALADLEDGLVMIKGAAQQAVHDADTARTAATAAEAAAGNALTAAGLAQTAATNAGNAATAAQNAADAAQRDATSANISANAALDQLGIVQDVVGVLEWASDHGTFALTQDQTIQDGKVYFTYDSGTGDYVPVVNPQQSELSTYYELSMDEAMQSFIMAHLAVTSRGLWVLPSGMASGTTPATGETQADSDARQGNDYKVLLANDGMYVYNGSGVMVGKYGSTAQIGVTGSTRFVINAGNLQAYDSAGNKYFEVSSSGLTFGSNTAATISDIDSAIEGLVDIKTSTGGIVSVSDASAYPAIDVQAEIVPSQPNKYDSVWVGGAGKNKLPKPSDNDTVLSGLTMSVADNGEITLNGTTTATNYIRGKFDTPLAEGSYTFASFNPVANNNLQLSLRDSSLNPAGGWHTLNAVNKTNSFTSDAGKTAYYWQVQINSGVSLSNFKFNPMLVVGSTAPTTFEPYENICPISGHTDVVVSRTGKNLLASTLEFGNIDSNGADSGTDTKYIRTKDKTKVLPSTEYCLYVSKSEVPAQAYVIEYDEGLNCLSRRQLYSDNTQNPKYITFTTNASAKWVRFFIFRSTAFTSASTNICLTYSGTDNGTYYSYTNDTYTIDLGGTRYGGTLDVTSGVLTITHTIVDLSTLNFNYDSGGKRWQITKPDIYNYPTRNADLVAEKYVADTTATAGDEGKMFTVGKGIYIYSTDSVNAPSGNLVYPLATPQTISLTAQEIELLQGTNNLWSNSGDTTLEYAVLGSDMLALAQQTGKNNKFITQIGSDGIKVHAEDNINQNYAKIDADGMEVYKGGNKIAKFGESIELSDGTQTLYEVSKLSGAVKVTRVYNNSFVEYSMRVEDTIELGRTVSSWQTNGIKVTYILNGTTTTATYSSLPVSLDNKVYLDISLTGTVLSLIFGIGTGFGSSETLKIVSFEFNFNTTQTTIESTLGAYADKTQTGVMRVGNGTASNAKSNAMLLDMSGNAFYKGDVYANCNADSTGGRSLSRIEYIPSAYNNEGSNWYCDIAVYRVGNVVMLGIYVERPVSISAGSNLLYLGLEGSQIPVPANPSGVTGITYAGNIPLIVYLLFDDDLQKWVLQVKNVGTSAVNCSGTNASLTYICDDNSAFTM